MDETQANCLFCKILAGEIPSQKVMETDTWYAFRDIAPQAPDHVLVIPRQHVVSIAETENSQIFAYVLSGIQAVAKVLGHEHYRVVVNNGAEAGQTVFHLHAHLLAGRPLTWPPG